MFKTHFGLAWPGPSKRITSHDCTNVSTPYIYPGNSLLTGIHSNGCSKSTCTSGGDEQMTRLKEEYHSISKPDVRPKSSRDFISIQEPNEKNGFL